MKGKKKIIGILTVCVIIGSIIALRSTKEDKITTHPPVTAKPLNITILLDLSIRIQDGQANRDTAVLGHIRNWFIDRQKSRKFETQDQIRVSFHPQIEPQIIPSINELQESLILDLTVKNIHDKAKVKKQLIDMQKNWGRNLSTIYGGILNGKSKKWPGSDIHGFFDEDIENYSIKNNYRNILIIITDGYIHYVPTEKRTIKDNICKTNWIEAATITKYPNISLINNRQGKKKLDNLEILVLEVDKSNGQFARIKDILTDWFVRMGVKKNNIKIVSTDYPANTKSIINEFLNKPQK